MRKMRVVAAGAAVLSAMNLRGLLGNLGTSPNDLNLFSFLFSLSSPNNARRACARLARGSFTTKSQILVRLQPKNNIVLPSSLTTTETSQQQTTIFETSQTDHDHVQLYFFHYNNNTLQWFDCQAAAAAAAAVVIVVQCSFQRDPGKAKGANLRRSRFPWQLLSMDF
jgi:hypothetical protein